MDLKQGWLVCKECATKNCEQCMGERIVYILPLSEASKNPYAILHWGSRVDQSASVFESAQKLFRKTLQITAFFVFLLGVGLFVYSWFIAYQQGALAWQRQTDFDWNAVFAFVFSHDFGARFFWAGILALLFFIFLKYKNDFSDDLVLKKEYENSEHSRVAVSWEEVLNAPEKTWIDVSSAFTPEASQAVVSAWKTAQRLKSEVMPVHLLTALLPTKRLGMLFGRMNIKIEAMVAALERQLAKSHDSAVPALSADAIKVLIAAYLESFDAKQETVDVDEILIAFSHLKDDVTGDVLYEYDITPQKIKNIVFWFRTRDLMRGTMSKVRHHGSVRSKSGMDRAMTALATPFLNQFSTDLTLQAKNGALFPLVGREDQIRQAFQIVESSRASVVFVGAPGVGKSALLEGIAQRMIEDDVPKILRDKRLVSLDISRLVAGADASEAEQRLLHILSEISRARNIILAVDNIQNLAGIRAGSEGSLELSEVLAQAIEKQQCIVFSSSPQYDYHRYLETHSALGQVLRVIKVAEMSHDEAIQTLEAKSGAIEYQNKVWFSYEALEASVRLTDRFMHENFLPSKALRIIEEAAAFVRHERGEGEKVLPEDIGKLISQKTGIPEESLNETEKEKLLHLEEVMHRRMVDQEDAVSAIAASLRRARAQIRDQKRPIANFLFLGPTGVGKTECAKTLAEVYFGDEDAMIRMDMSEYQDTASITRIIGSNAGALQTGYLTEAVRKNPYSLVLFDEVEKAHPDILNIFLQVMDDGRLTDASGRTIDFTQTIIIMTSNACTAYIQQGVEQGKNIKQIKDELINRELALYFRPEFLNRFDMISVFQPLSMEHVRLIAQRMIGKISDQLAEKGMKIKISEEALNKFASDGFDPVFGARPLRRVLQEQISDPIANAIIAGELARRDEVVFAEGGRMEIRKAKSI